MPAWSFRMGLSALALSALGIGACSPPPPHPEMSSTLPGAPVTPSLSAAPLAIDVVWNQSGAPTSPLIGSGPSQPEQIVVRWDPNDYSDETILAVADRECSAFNLATRPDGEPADLSASTKVQHFACVDRP